MEEVKQFVNMVNEALPGAWEATIRQMYINSALLLIVAMACGLGAGVLWVRMSTLPEDKVTVESIFVMIALGGICALTLILGVLILINPQYHAICALKSM